MARCPERKVFWDGDVGTWTDARVVRKCFNISAAFLDTISELHMIELFEMLGRTICIEQFVVFSSFVS